METLLKWLDFERGRRVELAKRLGVRPSAISQWRQVPAHRTAAIEAATGIPRQKLRPDLYAGMTSTHKTVGEGA